MNRWLGALLLLAGCIDNTVPVREGEEAGVGTEDGFMDGPDAFDGSVARDASDTGDATDMGGVVDAMVGVECIESVDCTEAFGTRGRCVGTADGSPDLETPSNNRCYRDLGGIGYRLAELSFSEPWGAAAFFDGPFNDWIRAELLNLTVYLEDSIEYLPSDEGFVAQYAGWIFNASDGRMSPTQPASGHPTTRADVREVECEPGSGLTCLEMVSESEDRRTPPGHLELWLPDPDWENQCALQKLTLPMAVRLEVGRQPGVVRMSVSGLLTKPVARRMLIQLAGRAIYRLSDLFEEAGIEPYVDSNGDGLPDAWRLAFAGRALQVDVAGMLVDAIDDQPCD